MALIDSELGHHDPLILAFDRESAADRLSAWAR